MKNCLRLFFWTAIATIVSLSAATAGSFPLVPHRAVYDLRLGGNSAGQILGLRGRLVSELESSCDGHITNWRMVTVISRDRQEILSDIRVATWESLDLTEFRFDIESTVNGSDAEVHAGRAELDSRGGPGRVSIDQPEEAEMDLPAGTVFQYELSEILVKRALAGERFLTLTQYDGTGTDGLQTVSAFIGKPRPPEAAEQEVMKPLSGMTAWPIKLAFFPAKERSETPDQTVDVILFENGVATELTFDYGDFSIVGEITNLDMADVPSC